MNVLFVKRLIKTMFSIRLSQINRLSRKNVINELVRKSHSDSGIPEKYQKFRMAHMNEFPVPIGSWKESYDAHQRKYNKQLLAGLIFFGGTLTYIYKSGVIDLVLSPPMKNPKADKESTKLSDRLLGLTTSIKDQPSIGVQQVSHLPESIPYLIIGGGTASFAAFRAIRANDPKAKVLVITDENYLPYMRPPLSKELWFSGTDLTKKLSFKQWNGRERSVFLEHEEFYLPLKDLTNAETGGVSVLKNHKVVKLDANEQKAFLDSGQIIAYDKCLIATGGKPHNISPLVDAVPEIQKRVILYRGIKDFNNLEELSRKAKSITIVGGGFLGSELACALAGRSKRSKSNLIVNQVFPETGNMGKVLPQYLCEWTTNKVRSEGIKQLFTNFVLNVKISQILYFQ